jgi:hypothetical protein
LTSCRVGLIGLFNMELTISPFWTKLILRLIPYRISHRIFVMCCGYNEDFENFTELVWSGDKHLDFYDRETYPEFQLWIR